MKSFVFNNYKSGGNITITIPAKGLSAAEEKLKRLMEIDYDQFILQENEIENLIKIYQAELQETFKKELSARGKDEYMKAHDAAIHWKALDSVINDLKRLLISNS